MPLTREQRAWLLRVLGSKTCGPQRGYLRFADISGSRVPLVIYVWAGEIPDSGGHVIGDNCNSEFDPQEHGLFPAGDCPKPTPLPVVP